MSGSAPTTPPEYWDKYRPALQEPPAAQRFDWTGSDDGGPGAELLNSPATALDLGPAEGENAAYLASGGTEVVAVDFSGVQVDRARRFWSHVAELTFIHAEACAYLADGTRQFDAIYSTWGAVWFVDPDELFPLVRQRLAPAGTFAFSHREPVAGQYGAQRMGGRWLEGRERELTVCRWQYSAEQWTDILKRHGFTGVRARVWPNREEGALGTLIVTARPS
ncbi:class I SAM-dependent methyltransferase [Streptomyces acidiscabies]|uniref:class I SAM-dependent methyltransferase n=1 Tax=Streptomyces acidiscabies TaxID=42234 RepID=UPI00073F91F3|nr:class I SAM-dependent methyltransferase [Streptomyces acidiscabies]